MLTVDEVMEYLAQLGLSLPASLVECLVAQVNALEACLVGAGLEPCAIRLALLQGAALLAIGTGARRVTSHTAPSGASQSFGYGTLAEQTAMLRNSIRALGAWGCLGPILPATGGNAALYVGLGKRVCR